MIGAENFQALSAAAPELNKAAALQEFTRHFDGAARQAPDSGDPGVVPAPVPGASSADHRILSLGERIARGITKDEGLKLVPWEPLWEGDRPTWRLVTEGENHRVQYVPEDLRHANPDVVMAHLMQEIFRACYSRPDLIEPELQSSALFRTLYDTLETGRVVQKGLKERPGLAGSFSAFHQEQYRDPAGEAEARSINKLPGYLRFLEGALYEGRQGHADPRIKDPRVLEVLNKTRSPRGMIAAASPEEAYRLSREIWPALQKLHEESEAAAVSQELFEKLGREGRLGLDKERNAAAGEGRLRLDGLGKRRREAVQKELEKSLQSLSPEQREDLRRQAQEQMRQHEKAFRKTAGMSRARNKAEDQDDALGPLLTAWSRQKSPGSSGQAGEPGDSQGQAGGGDINPSGTRGTSDSIGDIQDKIEKIKSGGLGAGQRRWLDEYLEPVRGMVDTLAYKIRKHLKAAARARDLGGLFEGDVDEDALPYYKAKIGIMKEELLPGRHKSRVTVLLDLSASMGRIGGGGPLDHAVRALLMALKAFKQAFKNEPGVEVRVVAYNGNPQLSIIGGYMQVKDLSDAVLYKAVERIREIQNSCQGSNCGVRMMDEAVQDIRENMKGHPDTTYALLHIGDGDPGADIASDIRAIYDDPGNARIRFANLAAGPEAQDMYDKYQPYSFWARELPELGMKWAEIVESTFKKSRRGTR